MQRVLLGLGMVAVVAGLAIGASGAFFNDTETSTGNTFTAGALDLRVDSTAHYNQMVCTLGDNEEYTWQPEGDFQPGPDHYPQPGMPCSGTWVESDLIPDSIAYRFFNLEDVKPGDEGENTISLHVYDNDAWGCFLVDNVVDSDVTCTEPESEDADDLSCTPAGNVAEGELGAALTFDAWLDQGLTPGFQNIQPGDEGYEDTNVDPTEGDNIYQEYEGPKFWVDETVDEAAEGPFAISDVLSAAYGAFCDDDNGGTPTGNTDYASCHGLAADGRMVGSTTYYFGLAWNVPADAGNEIQTDSLVADMIFEAAQHRNNPNFSCTPGEVRTTLTLAKTVIPADVAPDSDFTLTATGPDVISGIEGSPSVFFASVQPGQYDLSESGGPGGAISSWDCNIAMDDLDTVTIPEGTSAVCVVTNTYNIQ